MRKVAGYTLISMLVGLLIGVITVGSMLMLYRSLVIVAKDVNLQTARDGEAVAGALGAQLELQQAGFGVDGTTAKDLVLLSGAKLDNLAQGKLTGTAATSYGSAVRGNAVIWGFNPSGASANPDPSAYRCEGLLLDTSNAQTSQLYELKPVACQNAAAWATLSWDAYPLTPAGDVRTSGQFEVVRGSCWPFGHSTPVSAVQLNYYPNPATAASSFGRGGEAGVPVTMADYVAFSVCLSNLRS